MLRSITGRQPTGSMTIGSCGYAKDFIYICCVEQLENEMLNAQLNMMRICYAVVLPASGPRTRMYRIAQDIISRARSRLQPVTQKLSRLNKATFGRHLLLTNISVSVSLSALGDSLQQRSVAFSDMDIGQSSCLL